MSSGPASRWQQKGIVSPNKIVWNRAVGMLELKMTLI